MSTFRIGIAGGMGPMAGVRLQQLIIETTPARRDQDHFEVLCFTNPQVPDRTASLAADGGEGFVSEIRRTMETLVAAGASIIAVPCHTAHARFDALAADATVPIIDLATLTVDWVSCQHGRDVRVGLLATDGTIRAEVYPRRAPTMTWLLPTVGEQRVIASVIQRTKAGEQVSPHTFTPIVNRLAGDGAAVVILACTELSLYAGTLRKQRCRVVDPLQLLADELVTRGMAARGGHRTAVR
ncbi:MAG: amino acid racemase [bacterium]|nr:amino acid racemase [bacterium]